MISKVPVIDAIYAIAYFGIFIKSASQLTNFPGNNSFYTTWCILVVSIFNSLLYSQIFVYIIKRIYLKLKVFGFLTVFFLIINIVLHVLGVQRKGLKGSY